jgi:hypothetical protein
MYSIQPFGLKSTPSTTDHWPPTWPLSPPSIDHPHPRLVFSTPALTCLFWSSLPSSGTHVFSWCITAGRWGGLQIHAWLRGSGAGGRRKGRHGLRPSRGSSRCCVGGAKQHASRSRLVPSVVLDPSSSSTLPYKHGRANQSGSPC